ncbi:hypothetical protein FA048_00020 [Pedobacter polaris]|uniref:ParB-like N-terminal domain-containing protein n=1 Tax=Pedobacter polaris TaxID=2571273 RepID=A0A4U1CV81_9SPHI|nr:ParB N-terminal domain-containing protein [Pedobacter polaris]TKC12040.1 hypothetical protein FA048_00020 [Pedobacter polaris]
MGFSELKANIKQNGINDPLSYVENNGKKFVVDGNNRLKAARELGMKSVPVNEVKLPYGSYRNFNDLVYSRY